MGTQISDCPGDRDQGCTLPYGHGGDCIPDPAKRRTHTMNTKVSAALVRLHVLAEVWQTRFCLHREGTIEKVVEELAEYQEAVATPSPDPMAPDALAELGDLTVCLLRTLTTLSSRELEFLVSVMEMKTRRRIFDPGLKDPEAEKCEIYGLLARYL